MKICFILLISSLILATSCKDCPVRVIEFPKDTLREFEIKHNLDKVGFMRDSDTLKIEILDSNVVNLVHDLSDIFRVRGVSLGREGTNNWIYESITMDLLVKVNPNNKNEMWIYGFQANMDSTRTYRVGRFDNYMVEIYFSSISPYYIDKKIIFYVESTTE